VITASGLASSGSLRIIRSGVGSEIIAKVEGLPELVSITPFNIGAKLVHLTANVWAQLETDSDMIVSAYYSLQRKAVCWFALLSKRVAKRYN
jgi:hypothetical protein